MGRLCGEGSRSFDRVNHDILMDRLAKRITDKAVLRLIRHYLNAGIMANGVMQMRVEGTPQGGPLSPLLANVLLDEVDRELERKGHKFVRYADDCNVYVKSLRAGQRVLDGLRSCYAKLRLKVNETKTAVAPVWGRKKTCKRTYQAGRRTSSWRRRTRFGVGWTNGMRRRLRAVQLKAACPPRASASPRSP